MKKSILYRVLLMCIYCLAILCSCTNNASENIGENTSNDNAEVRIVTKSTESPYDLTNENITRLDVLVYDHDGNLFEHLSPLPTDIDGVFVAKMQKDIITGATNKDVFIVANWNETDVAVLKDMTSIDAKSYILTAPQTFNSSSGSFSGINMMSTCKLNHDFGLDRVLNIDLERIYSKLSLKFIYDYSGLDTAGTNRPTVSPKKVKVSLVKVEGIPTQTPLFPQVTANDNPVFQNYTFAPLVLKQGSSTDEITEMNADSLGTKIYDLFSCAPSMKLYPHHTAKNDTTRICFKFDFYEDANQPAVLEVKREIKIANVKSNSNYEIRLFINQMDKKTRTVSLEQMLNNTDFCRYEIVSIPYMKK